MTKETIASIDGIPQSEEAHTNLIRGDKSRGHDKMRKLDWIGCVPCALEGKVTGKRETLG
jgi:hypothetical protein